MKEITALHGFLGQPADWQQFPLPINPINLYELKWDTLPLCAKQLNDTTHTPSILMGYSLGGRVALHALIDQPTKWKAAIIVSAHSGLSNTPEQERRIIHDQQWANRFRTEPWEAVIDAWNGQKVFANSSFKFDRKESDYDREILALMLENGSLGKQNNLIPQIAKLPMPILWLTGAKDTAYCEIASTVNLTHPLSQKMTIPEVGHRLPWEKPQLFLEVCHHFIASTHEFH